MFVRAKRRAVGSHGPLFLMFNVQSLLVARALKKIFLKLHPNLFIQTDSHIFAKFLRRDEISVNQFFDMVGDGWHPDIQFLNNVIQQAAALRELVDCKWVTSVGLGPAFLMILEDAKKNLQAMGVCKGLENFYIGFDA